MRVNRARTYIRGHLVGVHHLKRSSCQFAFPVSNLSGETAAADAAV